MVVSFARCARQRCTIFIFIDISLITVTCVDGKFLSTNDKLGGEINDYYLRFLRIIQDYLNPDSVEYVKISHRYHKSPPID
jgi:hypothetical protein